MHPTRCAAARGECWEPLLDPYHLNDTPPVHTQMPLAALATEFSVSESQAGELAAVLVAVVKAALYDSTVDPALALVDRNAPGLDARLRSLIEQVWNNTITIIIVMGSRG